MDEAYRDRTVLALLTEHVLEQCWFVRWAYEWMQTASNRQEELRFWFGVQNLLVAAANISKALWGKDKGQREQRAPLRELLEVTDDSPLYDRWVRNHFEHLDTRFFVWASQSETGNVIRPGILPIPREAYVGGPGAADPKSWFRSYNPTTEKVRFWDHTINVRDAVAEVDRIRMRAEEAIGPLRAAP